MTTSQWLDAATLREIAVEASSDPRTVLKIARGERVRGLAAKRIYVVLARRGIAPGALRP
jgi:predicted transcriptional regulator